MAGKTGTGEAKQMTRTLLTVIFLTLFSQIEWANAYSGEELYNNCLPYTQNGFVTDTTETIECVVYIKGALDAAVQNCHSLRGQVFEEMIDNVNGSRWVFNIFADLHFSERPQNFNSLVQAIVNFLRDNPDRWRITAAHTVAISAAEVAPCKDPNILKLTQ